MKIIIRNTTKDRNVIVVPTEISQSHAVKFPPGYSTIDLETWKDKTHKPDATEKAKYGEADLHEGVEWYAKGHLESGALAIQEIEDRKDGKVVKRYATIRDFDAKRVAEIIEDTHDSSVLKEWKEMDSRDDVRAAIMTRMEKFNKKSN